MKPAPESWSADRVREEVKRGRKPFVLASNGVYHNLTPLRALPLDGDFVVHVGPHEVQVQDNFKRR